MYFSFPRIVPPTGSAFSAKFQIYWIAFYIGTKLHFLKEKQQMACMFSCHVIISMYIKSLSYLPCILFSFETNFWHISSPSTNSILGKRNKQSFVQDFNTANYSFTKYHLHYINLFELFLFTALILFVKLCTCIYFSVTLSTQFWPNEKAKLSPCVRLQSFEQPGTLTDRQIDRRNVNQYVPLYTSIYILISGYMHNWFTL
jgi:hypothetical protein